ncbi:MAG: hypothetical protein ABF430_07225, partial [Acetobacter persici]|uniref:hypothetical protein n=1 Tax=Acetobacter persici TaxID=1076596 RepID=UPI0039E72EEB
VRAAASRAFFIISAFVFPSCFGGKPERFPATDNRRDLWSYQGGKIVLYGHTDTKLPDQGWVFSKAGEYKKRRAIKRHAADFGSSLVKSAAV